jgi:hypothetical protein
VAFVPGIGTLTRFVAARSFGVGVALVRIALPEEADRERLRARVTAIMSQSWDATFDVVLSEQLIERTTDRLLAEGVVERVAERVVDRLLSQGVAERIAERVLAGPELDRILDLSVDEGRVEAIVARALESPSADRLVEQIVDSPGFERLVLSIGRSEVFDRLLDRALYSEELDRVVSHIAESDEVRAALTQQSAGLADEVAFQIRARTMAADELLERFARSLVHRRPREE